MFNTAISTVIPPVIAAIAGGVISWLITRGKNQKEADLLEIESIEKTVEIWKQLAQDLRTEYEKLNKSFQEMKQENDTLKANLTDLKRQMADFKRENHKLLAHIQELKQQA